MRWKTGLLGCVAVVLCPLALAQALPAEVGAALARARIPAEAVSMLVVDVQGKAAARLSHRAEVALNPASVMKLVTTYAALDLLGPAHTWRTPVYVQGPVREGTLHGNLYIRGGGDPKLVVERLWLLLRRVQALGIRRISGDIVLDGTAFEAPGEDPASFDGEPLRPYNVGADALLINFKSVVMTFVPVRSAGNALVQYEPALQGVQTQVRVPLSGTDAGGCGDYRAALKADFSDPLRIRFAGTFPAACPEKTWSVAYADPASYNLRAVGAMWHEIGGELGGTVREGRLPLPGAAAASTEWMFELSSAPLSELIRDINKYSNNVMAQQLFLSLSLGTGEDAGAVSASAPQLQPARAASAEASREVLRRWWCERFGDDDVPLIDNGSGLSRNSRISARALARLLQHAYGSAWMPELMASLPVNGVDGTLKRRRANVRGSAHLKTGSLRDVAAVAGYVRAASGKRYSLVAIVNHANAGAARAAFDALVDWTINDD